MSASASTAASASAAASATPRRTALSLLFGLLVIALVGRVVFSFLEPPFDGAVRFEDIAPLGGSFWASNLYLGGPSYAISWVAAAFFFAMLARGRTSIVTLAGAAITGIAGIVFALVVTAEALPFAFAADPAVMTEAEGRAVFDALNANLGILFPAILGSQLAIAVGVLLTLVAALISRATPRWFAIVGIVYLVVFVGLPVEVLGPVVGVIGYLLQVVIVAVFAWFGFRSALRVGGAPA